MSLCLGCPGQTQADTLYYCCHCILLPYYQSQSVTHNTNSCHFKIAVIVFCSCQNLLLLSVFRCHSPALAYNAIVHGLYHWHTLSPYYPTVWHSIEIFPQINLSWHFLEPQISLSWHFIETSNKLVCKLLSISSQPSMIQSCCQFWGRSMI